ncbi:type IV-A pilus assembly ATPase PilB [Oceanospirillum sediminis]|uniref:Type IV-A pilus assembly ATPase PilB n=1 Tax=Oceanospirillum sediminis TaxID=2760088 RepID=A0A839IJW0_9GAMM|nr:type IV-A pilus assembly ATPase PilB [Oceanospirillum sediminis]MBB1485465.1 type IV-A pilus assembly ATPase PilB [Oceanospirillum sediminis]
MMPSYSTEGIVSRLIQEHGVSEKKLTRLIRNTEETSNNLFEAAIHSGLIAPRLLAQVAAVEFAIPFMDLAAFNNKQIPHNILSDSTIKKHKVLPLKTQNNKLFLAQSDPTNLQVSKEIMFQTGLYTETILVASDQLDKMISQYLRNNKSRLNHLEQEESSYNPSDTLQTEDSDGPISRFINHILNDGIQSGASDIHFEPYEQSFRVRFRYDGLLREIAHPPFNLRNRIISRLKVLANLDISERRLPQDGSIKFSHHDKNKTDIRINTLPTLWGEKAVLRILDTRHRLIPIEQSGMSLQQQIHFKKALKHSQGMILVTGPTGSGKTVTLYTGLSLINSPENNILSAEDPVEINLEGVNQVNINPAIGLDFASCLRAFLRQDPDIIMLGEIRDAESAEIAVKAAQTGHLVLSTLHTNDASGALNRLYNLGVSPHNLASSVNLIIAQRLVRKLCQRCKTPISYSEEELQKAGLPHNQNAPQILYSAKGCDSCQTGYKGRTGVFEMLALTPEIREQIEQQIPVTRIISSLQKQGHTSLTEAGTALVAQGITSLEEIRRVISQ